MKQDTVAAIFMVFILAFAAGADEQIPQDLVDSLVARREAIREWAITCPPGDEFEGQYSIVDGHCWQGDVTCFAGLSCLAATLAGDAETADARCNDVAAAQASNGKWNRGATWVDKDYPDGDFSRDQTRGVFAYFIAHGYISQDPVKRVKARNAAERWLYWIDANDDKICHEDKRSCELTVSTHNMFYNVYRHLGVLPPRSHGPLVRRFYNSRWYYRWGFLKEIRYLFLDEKLRNKWYPRHLKAATLLLYRVLNMDMPSFQKRNRRAARILGKAARRIYKGDPTNPFYRLGYEGVTVDLVERVLDTYTSDTKPPALNKIHDWAWQRHTSERAWERSDGHDQTFLINLILARLNGKLNW